VAVTGAVIAVYTYRNGLDNMFSFIRQILIVAIVTSVVAGFLFVFLRTPMAARRAGWQRRQVS
jgi:fructose-specific phosphotransferase system IIC component